MRTRTVVQSVSFFVLGLEATAQCGPYTLVAEYLQSSIDSIAVPKKHLKLRENTLRVDSWHELPG
ncbi:MAG: hypothetical protein O2923_03720 [Verrucomicrobia bacterium]|nr:hypothetical protein [Verrucomicrobiota bacterium]MDA1086906.1 hypothetical protein [Verrucomicrobiota bacterium]